MPYLTCGLHIGTSPPHVTYEGRLLHMSRMRDVSSTCHEWGMSPPYVTYEGRLIHMSRMMTSPPYVTYEGVSSICHIWGTSPPYVTYEGRLLHMSRMMTSPPYVTYEGRLLHMSRVRDVSYTCHVSSIVWATCFSFPKYKVRWWMRTLAHLDWSY